MQEINGFKVSDNVFEQLSLKKPDEKKSSELGRGDFMKLLIAQLENQDPLSPQDNTAFVAQLAQFSTLDGIEKLNGSFETMNSGLKSNQAIQASALVGHTVFVNAPTSRLRQGGEILGSITVDKPTDGLLLNIYDSHGLLVRQDNLGAQDPGELRFGWDGRNEAGQSLPPGVYRFEALGQVEGETVGLQTTLSANVNSVTIGANGDMTLNVDGVGPLSISAVKEIL
jgi:flagellar basal-body rod modification protein FlgD